MTVERVSIIIGSIILGITIIVMLAASFLLPSQEENTVNADNSVFIVTGLETGHPNTEIVYYKGTGVMYIRSYVYQAYVYTPMFNADGSPMVYGGGSNEGKGFTKAAPEIGYSSGESD